MAAFPTPLNPLLVVKRSAANAVSSNVFVAISRADSPLVTLRRSVLNAPCALVRNTPSANSALTSAVLVASSRPLRPLLLVSRSAARAESSALFVASSSG